MEQIGRYEILHEIGHGGMAIVYKAKDTILDRPVAIKVIEAQLTTDEFRARFLREGKLMARLSHPHIITVYDIGEQNARLYLVMEYAPETLEDRLKTNRRLTEQEVITLGVKLLSAIEYLHREGVVHRDIKPSNILIDSSGEPKLGDFGIARAMDDTRLTRTGMFIGTPQYMAPEQFTGSGIDFRTDLYQLGVVLWECLCGKRPFDGETTVEIMYKVVNEPLPKEKEIKGKIATILNRALAKQPSERYFSAHEFTRAFHELKEQPKLIDQPTEKPTLTIQKKPAIPSQWKSKLYGGISGIAVGFAWFFLIIISIRPPSLYLLPFFFLILVGAIIGIIRRLGRDSLEAVLIGIIIGFVIFLLTYFFGIITEIFY